jgi:hypothetical protein
MRHSILALVIFSLLAVTGAAIASVPPPGTPLGACAGFAIDLFEGPAEDPTGEHTGPLPVPCPPVVGGYVVLYESSAIPPQASQNWSDILVFSNPGQVPQPGEPVNYMTFVSDVADPATGTEPGITDADLAFLGIHVIDIVSNPTTVYMLENSTSDLNPYYPISGAPFLYIMHSDPEHPTATTPRTWGRLKLLYR